MDKETEKYFKGILKALKPGELAAFSGNGREWIFRGEGKNGVPNGHGKWCGQNGVVLEGNFSGRDVYGKGKVITENGDEYIGERIDGELKPTNVDFNITFHMIGFEQEKSLIVQKDENGELKIIKADFED